MKTYISTLVLLASISTFADEVTFRDLSKTDAGVNSSITLRGETARGIFEKMSDAEKNGGEISTDFAMHREIRSAGLTFCVRSDDGEGVVVHSCEIQVK